MGQSGELPEPVLPLLTDVDRVEKMWAWLQSSVSLGGSQIRNGDLLYRGLCQEEVADRRMRGLCILLELLQSGLPLPTFPFIQAWEAFPESSTAQTSSTAGPSQHVWLNTDAVHSPALLQMACAQRRVTSSLD